MKMSGIIIIACGVIAFYMYKKVKRFPLLMMDQHMANGDYQKAIDTLNSASMVKVMSKFEKDAKVLKIYFMWGKKERFLKQLSVLTTSNYKKQNQERLTLLENWTHKFIVYEQIEFAQIFIESIKQIDTKKADFMQLCYDVLIDHKECFELLEAKSNAKKVVDFESAMYLYLIAYLCEINGDVKHACSYYNNALLQFDTLRSFVYYQHAKQYIERYGDESMLFFKKKETQKSTYRFTSEDFKEMYSFRKKKS